MSVQSSTFDVQSSASRGAVFLSYASQDAGAARRIAEALRAAGVEVWFDQNELVGGDAWDAKIRKQIKECALFVPVISATTQARTEGYFRLEWRLADQRTHLMAKGRPFLLPVVIDATRDAEAHVPDSFTEVQWTRLPGGETAEKFAVRVKNLLVGPKVGEALRSDGSLRPAESAHEAHPKAIRRTHWLVPAIVICVAAIVAGTMWQPWKKPEPTTKASVPAAATPAEKPVAALTAAQQLVEKARKILDEGDDMNRENYSLAEDLVERAVVLDPAEPLAWALYSRISYLISWFSFDVSEARLAAMRRQAERAHALAPELTEVQLAWADARIYFRQDLGGVERELLALAAREPKDWRVHRSLGGAYRYLPRYDDAIASHRRELELSGGLPSAASDLINVLIRSHRFPEAEAIMVPALATHATGRLRTHDVFIRTQWRGDLAGAQAALSAWPDWLLLEARGAIMAWRTALWAKQYDKALAVAQRMPRDYLRDTYFIGPRAVLTARAHEGAGHLEAARDDWRTVVQLTERELAKSPTDAAAAYWKAWALARLGDSTQAQALALQMQQRNLLSYRAAAQNPVGAVTYFQVPAAAPLWATVGRTDLALAELSGPAVVNDYPAVTRAMLELDPAFDALRTEPGFREVLAAAPAPESDAKARGTTARKDEKSVAVLAFRNLSDAQTGDYFSDGLSEELGNVLGRVRGLHVAGSTSAFSFKGKTVTLPEIARQLGVAYLVEGSVKREGSDVHITAKLISGADGLQVWTSGNLKRKVESSLALQEEIAGLIARELSLKLGVASAASTAAVNPQAFELYLQGRQAWNLRTPEGFDRAEALLNQALEIEPTLARAHAALADVWLTRGQRVGAVGRFGQRASSEQARIVAKAREALKFDPDSAEAHTSLGAALWNEWNLPEAERELRRAIALNPNYATAHQWLGGVLEGKGQANEALAESKLAAELDPLSSIILSDYSVKLCAYGRYMEAITLLDRALALQSNAAITISLKATAQLSLGQTDAAVALIRQLPADSANNRAYMIRVLGPAGLKAEAEALLPPVNQPSVVPRFQLLLAVGRRDEAIAGLDESVVGVGYVGRLLFEPIFDSIRDHPRFKQLIATLGLTEAHARAQAWRAAHPPEKAPAK